MKKSLLKRLKQLKSNNYFYKRKRHKFVKKKNDTKRTYKVLKVLKKSILKRFKMK